MDRSAWLPLFNVKVDGQYELLDGFCLAPCDHQIRGLPRHQGYAEPQVPYAALIYRDKGETLLCFDRALLSRALFVTAIIELVTASRVWTYRFIGESSAPGFTTASFVTLPSYGDIEKQPDWVIELRSSDIEEVLSVQALLSRDSSETRRASLALRRWKACRDRPSAEDSILDAWIGLEALFLLDNERHKREASSNRIHKFLTFDRNGNLRGPVRDRESRLSQADASYRARSEIVHGDTVLSGDIERTARQTEMLLQHALRLIVIDGEIEAIDHEHLRVLYPTSKGGGPPHEVP